MSFETDEMKHFGRNAVRQKNCGRFALRDEFPGDADLEQVADVQ